MSDAVTTRKPTRRPADEEARVKAFADQQMARLGAREKELNARADAVKKAQDAALATQRAKDKAAWDATVDAFCDAEATAGRVSPAELDPQDPLNLRVRLKALPAEEVLSFADAAGTAVTKSRREVELDAIRKRPVRMFGDRLAGGKPGADDPRTQRKQQIREFYAARNPAAKK